MSQLRVDLRRVAALLGVTFLGVIVCGVLVFVFGWIFRVLMECASVA